MRASTLFGLTIAILIGMAVVFGVKSSGLFDREPPKTVTPDRPKILVANKNMYENFAMTANDVIVRPVEDSEMDHYIRNKHKYMPPNPMAADHRELARNVVAGEPLLREHFKDHVLPPSFDGALRPGMRAVHLNIPKDRGAALIRRGDTVDVHLTTTICVDPECRQSRTMSAPIATGLKVIFKRDSLWQKLEAVDDVKPTPFTLEANPYRAALIDFAKTRGQITLIPSGPNANDGKTRLMPEMDKEEEQKIVRFSQDRMPITDRDLEEIFKLNPIVRPRQVGVELWYNIQQKKYMPAGEVIDPTPPSQPGQHGSGYGYRFNLPNTAPGAGPGWVSCDTCPGGKKYVGN
jgi:Flp pilus assembly protein CpaB